MVASLHLLLLRPVEYTSGSCASTYSAQNGFSLYFCHLMSEHSSFDCHYAALLRNCHRWTLSFTSRALVTRSVKYSRWWFVYLRIACGQTVSPLVLSTIRFPSNWSVSRFRVHSVRGVGEGHMGRKSLLQSF